MNQAEEQDLYRKAKFIKKLVDKDVIPNSVFQIDYKDDKEKRLFKSYFGEDYLPFVEFRKRSIKVEQKKGVLSHIWLCIKNREMVRH